MHDQGFPNLIRLPNGRIVTNPTRSLCLRAAAKNMPL